MALPGVGALLGGVGPADRSAGYLLALGAGTLLVGFSEEMLTRGTGLVGLRGGFGEAAAWFFSCLIFGLIHALNVFFGQAIGTTVQQIGFAFVALSLVQWGAFVLAIAGVVIVLRRGSHRDEASQDALARPVG